MIRRSQTDADGRDSWILLTQIEHARIAGVLAESWGNDTIPAPYPRKELIETVYHHDDGWSEWEKQPGVDPQTGRPLGFTEMPLLESLAIWRRSIEVVESIGPLAAYVVAGHFGYLLGHAEALQEASNSESLPQQEVSEIQAARAWLAEFDACRTRWLEDWQRQDPAKNTLLAARAANEFLAQCDVLSLALCCGDQMMSLDDQGEDESLPAADGPTTMFISAMDDMDLPILSLTSLGKGLIEVDPWPFSVDGLELSGQGHSVPVAEYSGREALAAAKHQPITLNWRLEPSQ